MNDQQLLRYSRHILLDEIGVAGQERLRAAHAFVVGAGGLGCPEALYLAASGVGKMTIAALEATLALYREPARAVREIPALAMLTADAASLRIRAQRVADAVGATAGVVESTATVGGGAFPTARLASFAVALGGSATAVEARLRSAEVPVIARISDGHVLVDMRSVLPDDDELLAATLRAAAQG